jgi:branched-chain amino acid transport system ATP-binding protein
VLLDGEDVTGLAPHRLFARGLVRTFQIPATFDRMTVRDNLMVVPAGQTGESLWRAWLQWGRVRAEDEAIRARADQVLAFLNIGQVADEYAGNLSGGQKKRVAFARATITKPPILLLDEPAAGLDPVTSQRLFDLIRKDVKASGATCVVVSSDLDRLLPICDRVGVLVHGELLFDGTVEEAKRSADARVYQFVHGLPDGPL